MDIASDFLRVAQRDWERRNIIYTWEVTPLSQELPAEDVQHMLFKQNYVRDLQPTEIVNLVFRCQPLYQQLDKMLAETQFIWDDKFADFVREVVDENRQNRSKILQAYHQITPNNPQTPKLLHKLMIEHGLFLPLDMLNQLAEQAPSLIKDLNEYRRRLSRGNPLLQIPEDKTLSPNTQERSL